MRATCRDSWRSTRSLRLPNTLVRARLNIGYQAGSKSWEGPRARSCGLDQPTIIRGAGAQAKEWRRDRADSSTAGLDPAGGFGGSGPALPLVYRVPRAAHKGQRIHHAAAVPHLEMDVRTGGAAGGTHVRNDVAGVHAHSHVRQQLAVV